MDLNAILSQLEQLSAKSTQDIKATIGKADINNPDQMLKAQFAMQQYSNLIGYESAIIKTIKDMVQGIIAKL